MYFASQPPEITSALIYAGPGSGPMLAAADAWASLSADLYSAAGSYAAVVSGLAAGPWLGSSSARMAAAAASYLTWMNGTAAQAQQSAAQATAAAVAFEAAFAATVPPEVVEANRSLLAALVATNLLGQNTPAIAATEALYGEMWAQDAAAMYGYADAAASATRVTPFEAPQATVDPAAAAGQAGAVSQAAETSAGSVQSTISQMAQAFSAVPEALSNIASANVIGSLTPLDLFDFGADLIAYGLDAPIAPLSAISLPVDLVGAQTGLHTDDIVSGWQDAGAVPGLQAVPPVSNVSAGAASAGWGEANAVGGLSVPPSWTAATPAVRPVALTLPTGGVGAVGQALAAGSDNTLSDFALSSLAGRSLVDTLGTRRREPAKAAGNEPAAGARADGKAETPNGEDVVEPRTAVTGIAAEIRDLAKLRDEGLITGEQFVHQRNRLLGM